MGLRLSALAVCGLLAMSELASAQVPDDEALKSVVKAETQAFYDRDFDAWQDKWLHDPSVSRQVVGYGRSNPQRGWDTISAAIAQIIKANPPVKGELSVANFLARKGENYAWVEYDELITIPQSGYKGESRERRLLLKSGNQWKIASSVSVATSTYENSPANVESRINQMGYSLLESGKTTEAIEMFKVNVSLYPQSWNAYDSLGEAYATAGQTKLAIQNYEKSVSLNPKNDTGQAALAKLRGK